MELSSIEIFKIISALNKEIESDSIYLNNIYQVMNDSYLFKLHQVGKPKKYIMVNPKIGIWASKYDIDKDESIGYVTALRKNLLRAKLIKFEQPPGERICIIHFETKKGLRKIICEFFRGGNIIVIDENNKILSCLKKLKVRHREIFPGSIYKFPPLKATSIENFQKDDLKNINETELEIAKWIGRNYSISKKYIEEILKKIEIEKERKCNTLSDEEIENLETEIIGLIKIMKSDDMSVWIARDGEIIDDISLMNLGISKEKTYHKSESLMSELDNYITLNLSRVQTTNKQKPLKNKIIELEKSIKLQEEAYNNNKNKAIELRNIATELSKANSYIEILKGKNIEIIKYRN
ncbi:MAG: fibronectin/fibrinogen-binding protein, partial [Thaumarchaeota archaeon]|nr:fibronectin/fibrinogen-binding protein [Nitrososphaerota archaeon]